MLSPYPILAIIYSLFVLLIGFYVVAFLRTNVIKKIVFMYFLSIITIVLAFLSKPYIVFVKVGEQEITSVVDNTTQTTIKPIYEASPYGDIPVIIMALSGIITMILVIPLVFELVKGIGIGFKK